MFTGLIEEIGIIGQIRSMRDGRRLFIEARKVTSDCKVDDSVAVNGVCLTVVQTEAHGFWVEAVGETLRKTTVGQWRTGLKVNLERALRLNDRLGGHLVQGHVNGIGYIRQIRALGENYVVRVEVPAPLLRYLILEGSVAIDGISLTVADLTERTIGLSIIPHTFNHTNLRHRQIGNAVNIEVDLIAKYVERLLGFKEDQTTAGVITPEWLRRMGF